jgi:hypothetical protein
MSMESKEVARCYRAEALQLKSVINDKGRDDQKDQRLHLWQGDNIFAGFAVSDLVGPGGHLTAIHFYGLKVDDSRGEIVLAGVSQASLGKLPSQRPIAPTWRFPPRLFLSVGHRCRVSANTPHPARG